MDAKQLKPRKSEPLAIVERVVRNLPITKPEFLFVETDCGPLYIALGKDGFGAYHGVWAFTRGPGIARTISFAKNQLRTLVIKELLTDGYQMLNEMHGRGMLDEGYFGR
jgi:hypothetical protein